MHVNETAGAVKKGWLRRWKLLSQTKKPEETTVKRGLGWRHPQFFKTAKNMSNQLRSAEGKWFSNCFRILLKNVHRFAGGMQKGRWFMNTRAAEKTRIIQIGKNGHLSEVPLNESPECASTSSVQIGNQKKPGGIKELHEDFRKYSWQRDKEQFRFNKNLIVADQN